MAECGQELQAIYHSHPHGPPHPSVIDIEQHQYPDTYYLIISLTRPDQLELLGFLIRDGTYEEVGINIS